MRRRINKKGSIELSMQTIVIVVIAVILLSGGIAWVSKLFKGLDDITKDMNKVIGDQINKIFDMDAEAELAIYAPAYEIKQGIGSQFGIGIRNIDSETHAYNVEIKFVSSANAKHTAANVHKWLLYDTEEIQLSSGKMEKKLVAINIPKSAPLGMVMLKVVLIKDGEETDSEDFTITVK